MWSLVDKGAALTAAGTAMTPAARASLVGKYIFVVKSVCAGR